MLSITRFSRKTLKSRRQDVGILNLTIVQNRLPNVCAYVRRDGMCMPNVTLRPGRPTKFFG